MRTSNKGLQPTTLEPTGPAHKVEARTPDFFVLIHGLWTRSQARNLSLASLIPALHWKPCSALELFCNMRLSPVEPHRTNGSNQILLDVSTRYMALTGFKSERLLMLI